MTNPITEESPSDEDELQRILAEVFRSNGWTAIREYTPDKSQKRIDLFVEHPKYGKIGIETKHLRSDRDGSTLAQAYIQITRDYWKKRYNGEKILLWAIAPYFSPGKLLGSIDDDQIKHFVREFITATGVGYIDCHADTLTARFSESSFSKTIPIAGPYVSTYSDRVQLERLRNHVRERRQDRNDTL